ncbi:MAG TPA: hypothetical protein VM052_04035 [Candidatus Limnocylindrales bacterium]|nr:hypothetical protein [Candidatus Limnocylindrales bacterium]
MTRAGAAVIIAAVALIVAASPVRADDFDPGYSDATPTPIAIPPGLYLVTDVYAGNVVTSSGGTTTYSTTTVHASPGTYARVLESVGTGMQSRFDGRSFNGRLRLADGRAVAGTYYETFILTPSGFVSVNIVFFQDDSETRQAQPTEAPRASSTAGVTAAPIAVPTVVPVSSTPTPAPTAPVRTASPATTPAPPAPTAPPRVPVFSAGVALSSRGPVLVSVEVLRGRRVELWPRLYIDGVPAVVRTWRLIDGFADVVSRTSGGAVDPSVATWLTFTPDGAPSTMRFEITSDAAPGRAFIAIISVTVRSPALLQ